MSETTFMRDAIKSAVEDLEESIKFYKKFYAVHDSLERAHRTLVEALEVE